jgi:hypothetical protein
MTTTKMFNGLETTVLLYFLQLSNLLTGKSFHNRLAGSGQWSPHQGRLDHLFRTPTVVQAVPFYSLPNPLGGLLF